MTVKAPQLLPNRVGTGESGFPSLGLFLGVLGAALAALFPEVVLGSHTFYYRDYGAFGYPLAWHLRESLAAGELPLWNPLSNCGLPFLAQWNTLCLYPPLWLFLLLPMPWALGWFGLLHLLLGGAGMFRLAGRWTGNSLGAGLAGLSFALGGLSLHALMWPNNIAALGWMPWVILAGMRAVREGGRQLLALVWPALLQMLAGAPEVILLTWLALAVLALAEPGCATGFWRARWLAGARLLLAGALVAGMAAIQLVPFLHLLLASQRDAGFDTDAWSMPVWGWANLLVPLFHTTPSLTGVHTQADQQWTSSYYCGLTTVALAWLACRRGCGQRVLALSGLVVFGLVMALGKEGVLYSLVKTVIPPLGFLRFPVKWVILATFCLPLLAAFGWQGLASAPVGAGRRMLKILVAFSATVILILGVARVAPTAFEDWRVTWMNGAVRLLLLLAGFGLLWRLLNETREKPRRWLALGVLMMAALDAITHAPRQNPVVETRALQPAPGLFPPGLFAHDQRVGISPYRHHFFNNAVNTNSLQYCYRARQSAYANWNLVDGIAKINGFYSLYPRRHAELAAALYASTNRPPAALLDFLGVRWITSDARLFEWDTRPSALPLVTAGQRPVFADDAAALRLLFSDEFNPRGMVLLPASLHSEASSSVNPADAAVRLTRQTASEWEMAVDAARPTVVVVAQTWHPHWRAWVNGRETPIWRANFAFQAIPVPAGASQVRLRYVDRAFFAGAVLSGLAALIWLGAWLRLKPKSPISSP